METFSSLLFELSSGDRLDILMLLRKKPLKLSHISNKLNFTVQETSRNVTRLSEANLIAKDIDSTFHLTPYGEEALNLLSGFKFLFKNRAYLTTHVLDALPKPFRAGLGILENFEFVDDVMIAFHNIETMIAEADKFVWILTNQVLMSTVPHLVKAVERGIEFRLILPIDFVPSKGLPELISNPVFEGAWRTKRLESKFLDKVNVFICLSETQVAALSFPNLENKFEYTGFKSGNESAVEWGKILFTFYWNKASSHVPQQLFNK